MNNTTLPINRAHTSPVAADVHPRSLNPQEISPDSRRRRHPQASWLTLLAAAALLLSSANLAQADYVFFDDGLTHTIDNATYQNDRIFVESGTTLIIEPGAVLGGAGYFSGAVQAYDTSTVTINGGTFGGAGMFSGAVEAYDTSTVTINGGTFGGSGDVSGAVFAYDTSTVTINGGTFGGWVGVFGGGTATINGGTFSGPVVSESGGTVKFRASSFDTTLYNPTSGGTLGVTFCGQSPQNIAVYIRSDWPGFVVLENIVCETPADLINDLIAEVNALSIQAGIENALVVKLNAALKALESDDAGTAWALLGDFIDLCTSQSGKKIDADDAVDLTDAANDIRDEV